MTWSQVVEWALATMAWVSVAVMVALLVGLIKSIWRGDL